MMANPFAQLTSEEGTSLDQSAGGQNPFAHLDQGVTVDEEEQQVMGQVNSVKVRTPETFGFTTIPKDVGKGIARELLSLPQDIGATIVEAGETAEAFSGKTALQTARTSFMGRFAEAIKEDGDVSIYELLPMVWGVEKDVALNLAFDEEGSKVATAAGYNMIQENRQQLEEMGLVPKGETSFAYDVGQGFASILRSVGLIALTKNPTVAGGYMGWMTNSRDYLEARNAGKTPEQAAAIAATSATGQAAIETIGGKYFMTAAKGSTFVKSTVKRILGQSAEEVAQSGVELSVKNVTEVRDNTFGEAMQEMAYAGLIGAVSGAPVAAAVGGMQRLAESRGVPRDIAKPMAESLGGKYAELEDVATALIDKESTKLATDPVVVEDSIRASTDAIAAKEAELTEQAKTTTEPTPAEREVAVEVEGTVAAVDSAAQRIEAVVRQNAQSLTEDVTRVIEEKIALLKNKRSLLAEGSKPMRGGKKPRTPEAIDADVTLVDEAILDIDAALTDAGIDPVKLADLKLARRELRKQADQAERTAMRAAREAGLAAGAGDVTSQQRQADYEAVANKDKPSRLAAAGGKVREIAGGALDIGSDVFTPVSTRLGKINKKLKTAVRRYAFNTGMHLQADKQKVKPLIESMQKMEEADYRVLDLALKNKDQAKVGELLSKYGMTEQFNTVRETLDELFDQARDVSIDMHYMEEYFPRLVRRDKVNDYLAALRGRDDWSQIQAALDEADPDKIYTEEEKADFVNRYLRGFASNRILLTPSGSTKERAVDYVTPEFNEFYEPSPQALVTYIDGMRYGIEARRFFGKGGTRGTNLRNFLTVNEDAESTLISSPNFIREDADNAYTVEGEPTEAFKIELVKIGDTGYQVINANVVKQFRGKSLGLGMYAYAILYAKNKGVSFLSDSSVSAKAGKLYDRLSSLGVPVVTNEDAKTGDSGRIYMEDEKTPVYVIDTKDIDTKVLNAILDDSIVEDSSDRSIGEYVHSLVSEGSIQSKQEDEVKKILQAVVDQQGTRGVVTWAKNASYIAVMGSPISAITQLGDLAFSMAFNGYYNSSKALGKAVFRRSAFTKESVGIDHVLQEFEGESSSAKAVRKVFKAVGLEYMDNIGKETFMNSALSRLQKQAKKGGDEFNLYMEEVFGEDAGQVTQDLINGLATEDVKFLLFSELSDVQPISLAEMPVGYLRGGNMRVLYMLKTYTIKLVDIHRRKWIDEIASGDPKRMARGVNELVRLTAALAVMGVAADSLKNLILDKEFEIEDIAIDNLLKMAGISRYQVFKTRKEGLFNSFWQWFIPPVGTVTDDLVDDMVQIGLDDKKLKDAETAKNIPVGGKLYYWWWGGGRTREKKKNKKVSTL